MIRRWGGVFDEFERMMQEFNRLFEETLGGSRVVFALPAVEIEDAGDSVVVRAMIPGLNKEDVEVIVDDDRIVIRGEYKKKSESKEGNLLYSEIAYGTFERIIPLPVEVLTDEAKAKFENGVLTITLPKATRGKRGRRLDIE